MPMLFSYRDGMRLEAKIDALLKHADIEINLERFSLQQEANMAKTIADIETAAAATLAKANAEGDAITAIAGVISDVKAQNATLIQELADAVNSGNQAEIDTAFANLSAANDKLDANAIAEASLEGTNPPAPVVVPPVTTNPAPVPGAPPIVSAITPATGLAAGGETVTIVGSNLSGIMGVTFGGTAAPSVAPDHSGSLTVTTPPGNGQVDVIVTTSGGTSAPVPFSYAG